MLNTNAKHIILPIYDSSAKHWALLIVLDVVNPKFIYYDSLFSKLLYNRVRKRIGETLKD